MAEVFVSFDTPIGNELGTFHARVVGRHAEDGMWDGWLEFVPIDGNSDVVVGPVESRQPERHDLAYWASGLTPVFLEGALRRAQRPLNVRVRTVELPSSDVPAQKTVTTTRVMSPGPEPVLDPFDVGGRNPDILKQELGALNRPRLLNIIVAYDLNPGGEDIAWMSERQLIQFIVTAVEAQLIQRAK